LRCAQIESRMCTLVLSKTFKMENDDGDWEALAESGVTAVGWADAEQVLTKPSAPAVANANKAPAPARSSAGQPKKSKRVSALAAACRKHDQQAKAAEDMSNELTSFVGEFALKPADVVDGITDAENEFVSGTAAVSPAAQTDAQNTLAERRKLDAARAERETLQLAQQLMGAGKTGTAVQPPKSKKSRRPTLGRDTGNLRDWDDD